MMPFAAGHLLPFDDQGPGIAVVAQGLRPRAMPVTMVTGMIAPDIRIEPWAGAVRNAAGRSRSNHPGIRVEIAEWAVQEPNWPRANEWCKDWNSGGRSRAMIRS
jgi:hypothetical protein